MKQRIGIWTLVFCLTLMLAGCASDNGEGQDAAYGSGEVQNASADTGDAQGDTALEESIEEDSAAEVPDPVPAHTDYVTEEMYQRAISFQQGDLSRLAAVMRKAQAGEEITVGVIGGSITEGYSANKKENSYASLMHNWWQERFPDVTVQYVNAGIGGTSSYLGVHRVQKELLEEEPDFVIVEFSVNDGNNIFYKISYDNLLRRILMDENQPALMLLFTTQEDGTNAQVNDALLGFGYGLPMISYGNAVLPAIDAGEFTWKDISPDNIHPNDRGHAIIGELIYRYLNDVYARLEEIPEEIPPFTADVQTKERYMNGQILDGASLTPVSEGSFTEKVENWYFPYNNYWHTKGGDEAIAFDIEAANIGILYQRDVNDAYGMFDIYIDGEHVRTLNGNFVNGWGNSMAEEEIYVSEEAAMHRVEVRKNPDSDGDLFTV
ncbi:MAG: SGNH/GDSL hydrolase family protein, partial [Acetatifactor sp.]|nr:SGNH/GDSL hydrolase family protein [Acetatifactor sp.]